ncbi:MAG: DUF945 family protein [Pseudomonadota bacterium]
MKKGVLAGIIILALVLIVSPGIVGKLGEESLDENLNRAADQSAELVVTSQGFERGWFSSEGEHRIELGDGELRQMLTMMSDGGGEHPVLIINTKIDHGIIPVTSMSRDHGSLAPGLGSAVSTMRLELEDGSSVDIPGEIYSKLALNGDLDSEYVLEAGSTALDEGTVEWLDANIKIEADASSGGYGFDGEIGGMVMTEDSDVMTIGPMSFSGDQEPGEFGYLVGDVDFTMDSVRVVSNGNEAVNMSGLKVVADNAVDGDRVVGEGSIIVESMTVPDFGNIAMNIQATSNTDAEALGLLMAAMDKLPPDADPSLAMMMAEQEGKNLFAAGLDFAVPRFDVELPMGAVEMAMSFSTPEQDRDAFEWTSLLLKGQASFDMKVPEALVQMATSMNPQAGGIVAMGYLRKEGDYYVMDADMEQGLLTINGAPIPIPMGAF